ncbi:glutamine synthetase [bacterium]|nr:glutamine synthetase [bacterium]
MSTPQFVQAEYIWQDGTRPTQKLRSKTRIIATDDSLDVKLELFPEWSFDGSSTNQAGGGDSDCILQPVLFVRDPIRGPGNYLVLCEVYDPDGKTPHKTNNRAELRRVLDAGAAKTEPWIGFEQEYTLLDGQRPLGFPDVGFPAPQGPYYCGVGSDEAFGREVVEAHTEACIDAGIMIYGINAEVMPGQWEFQIGYRGVDSESADPLTVSDHTILARWLIFRIGEEFGVGATLHPKPVRGDWNGTGMHTNFSTAPMREASTGKAAMENAIAKLGAKHDDHIKVYGHGLRERLTGLHETCDINTFKSGVADRGASIRIPRSVANKGYGYLEDRRPGANADPYQICTRILKTINDIE